MKVVTISGSMKFADEMKKIAFDLEVEKGYCVIQCVYNVENKNVSKEQMDTLSKLHFKKIELSDCLYVVNIGGYIGSATKQEIDYAVAHGKEIIYHEKF